MNRYLKAAIAVRVGLSAAVGVAGALYALWPILPDLYTGGLAAVDWTVFTARIPAAVAAGLIPVVAWWVVLWRWFGRDALAVWRRPTQPVTTTPDPGVDPWRIDQEVGP